jgi:hypothetical protein
MGYLLSLSKSDTLFALHSSEWVLLAASIVLVIGIAGEYKDKRVTGLAPEYQEAEKLRKWKTLFKWAVIIGIIGEFLGEGGVFLFSSQRESIAEAEYARVNKEAGEAKERAANLQAAMADRELSPDQQSKIRESLKLFPGKIVYMRSYPNDWEAARLIRGIKGALEPSIHVEDRTGELTGASTLSEGVVLGIRIEPAQNDRRFAEALVETFRIDGKLSVNDLSPFGSASSITEILVGVRPMVLADKPTKSFGRTDAPSKFSRHLRPEQIARITSKIRLFAGQPFGMVWFSGDAEIDELETDLLNACCETGSAGWTLAWMERPKGPASEKGILILVMPNSDDRTRKASRALAAALHAEHLDVKEFDSHSALLSAKARAWGENKPLTVIVGKKP